MLSQNYALKLNNEDYKQMDHQKALDDFKDRVKAYEQVYEVRTVLSTILKFKKTDFSGWESSKQAICLLLTFLSSGILQPIQDYEDNAHISYIKMVNVGEKVITRNCTGYLPSQVALYLQNIHIQPRYEGCDFYSIVCVTEIVIN